MKRVSRVTSNKRLLQLAAFLEELPGKHFDFSVWGTEAECGTVACALGWAVTMPFAKRYGITLKRVLIGFAGLSFYKDGNFTYGDEVGMDLFGLSDEAIEFLFTPGDPYSDGGEAFGSNGLDKTSSAKTVAVHIRRFVAIRSS